MPEPGSPNEQSEPVGLAADPWIDRLWQWRRRPLLSTAIGVVLAAVATALRVLLDPLIGDPARVAARNGGNGRPTDTR